jgi:predicted Fe-S protein YdhL (DUF1289 family)
MTGANNQNDNQEIKNEREAAEEHLWRHYSPDEMQNVWYFRLNESLKAINKTLQTIATELNQNRTE